MIKHRKHNPNWPEIPEQPCKILIIGGSEYTQTKSLFNLINQQLDSDKT